MTEQTQYVLRIALWSMAVYFWLNIATAIAILTLPLRDWLLSGVI